MHLVSVGIPTYNRAAGLHNTLLCISKQTYPNLEIVVSDNCSSGEEVNQIMEEFCKVDSRVIYFRQSANIGAAKNFRFVLEKAKGDYFMWAADDDEFSLNYIEENLKELQSNGNYIGSYGYLKDYENPGEIRTVDKQDKNKFRRVRKHLRNPSYNMGFYSLFKTEIIRKTNAINFDYYGGDWFLIAYLLKRGTISRSLNTYVIRGNNGLSSNAINLIQHFYRDSKWKYFPFFIPTLKYLRLDLPSALLNLDLLLYYNLFYSEFALENYKSDKYSLLRRIARRLKAWVQYCMSVSDRYFFRIH